MWQCLSYLWVIASTHISERYLPSITTIVILADAGVLISFDTVNTEAHNAAFRVVKRFFGGLAEGEGGT
jgi:hypothetical protein